MSYNNPDLTNDRYVEKIRTGRNGKYKVIVDTHCMMESPVSQAYGVDEDISDKIQQMNEDYYNQVLNHLKRCGVIK